MNQWDWIGLFDVYQMIFWSVTYIECIRIAKEQHTYCMPFLALCMNFCWEVVSLADYIINRGENAFMYVLYGLWVLLDIGVVITYCLYGEIEYSHFFSKGTRKIFIFSSLITFLFVFGIIEVMYNSNDNWKLYFSFADNALMSALFIAMYYIRGGKRGQSISIAITKCIGTFCATMTVVLMGQVFGIVVGGICLILDVVYIIILHKHSSLARWKNCL